MSAFALGVSTNLVSVAVWHGRFDRAKTMGGRGTHVDPPTAQNLYLNRPPLILPIGLVANALPAMTESVPAQPPQSPTSITAGHTSRP